MSNRLITVNVSSSVISSGDTVDVDVDYASDDGGRMYISHNSGFSISTDQYPLPPAQIGNASFKLSITRTTAAAGDTCNFTFSFYATTRHAAVRVN